MSSVVRFRAEGPVAVSLFDGQFEAQTSEHVEAVMTAALLGAVVSALPFLYYMGLPGEAAEIVAMVSALGAWLAMIAGLVVYRRFVRWRVVADGSGVRTRSDFVPWDEVREVTADNVHFRSESEPGQRVGHAVVLMSPNAHRAFIVPTFDEAESLAAQLEFLRRTSVGAPDDVPESIAALRGSRQTE